MRRLALTAISKMSQVSRKSLSQRMTPYNSSINTNAGGEGVLVILTQFYTRILAFWKLEMLFLPCAG
jgi:hypothetical protein